MAMEGHEQSKNVAFRRKALFAEGLSKFIKVAGMQYYYPRPEDPSCSLTCPGNRQEKNNNSECWQPVEEHCVGLQTPASRITRKTLKKKKYGEVEFRTDRLPGKQAREE